MSYFHVDLFEFWRLVLWITCTVYASVMLARTACSWYALLYAPNRQSRLLRRYVQFQLLRVRLRPLRRELAMIGLYASAFGLVLWLHKVV